MSKRNYHGVSNTHCLINGKVYRYQLAMPVKHITPRGFKYLGNGVICKVDNMPYYTGEVLSFYTDRWEK